jgi:hypothetical protein
VSRGPARRQWMLAGLLAALLLAAAGGWLWLERGLDAATPRSSAIAERDPARTDVQAAAESPGTASSGFESLAREGIAATGAVVGRVEDDLGQSLATVHVRLGEERSFTNDAGRFRLPAQDQPLTLRIDHSGFLPLELEVGAGACDLGTLVIRRAAASIEGLVLGSDGAAVPDAAVEARIVTARASLGLDQRLDEALAAGRKRVAPVGTARSDGSGRFVLPLDAQARERAISLEARAPGEAGGIELEPAGVESTRSVVIQLAPVARVDGRVVEPDGRGIAGLPVVAAPFSADGSAGSAWRRDSMTDENGRFSLEDVPAEFAALAVRTTEGSRELVRFQPPLESELVITLDARGGLEGLVLDADDRRPIQGASVAAWNERKDGVRASWSEDTTDAEGRFQLRGLPPGEVRALVVRHPDYTPAGTPMPFTLPRTPSADEGTSGSEPFEVLMRRGLSAVFEVHEPDGSPAAGAQVELEGHGGLVRATARTGDSGIARVRCVPAGFYRFEVRDDSGVLPPAAALTSIGPGGERVVLDLVRPVRVRGEVRTLSGTPVEGAVVRLSVRTHDGFGVLRERTLPSDGHGKFAFSDVPPESAFEVAVVARGSVGATVTGITEPGLTDLDLGAIQIDRGAEIRGRVVDGDGAPFPGAAVQVVRATGSVTADWTDADGSFVLSGLAPGRARVVVTANGHPAWFGSTLELGPGAADVELLVVLADGMFARGRVVDERGRSVARAQVGAEWTLFGPEIETTDRAIFLELLRFCRAHGETDATGEFVLFGLPSNRPARVTASAPGLPAGEAYFHPGEPDERLEVKLGGEER